MASSPSHDLAPTADEQVQVNASADHLLMLASGVWQPAEPSVIQVSTPGRTRCPSDLRSGDLLANMIVPDAGRESGPASPASESSSGYFTASKLLLPLQAFHLCWQKKQMFGVLSGLFLPWLSQCQQR